MKNKDIGLHADVRVHSGCACGWQRNTLSAAKRNGPQWIWAEYE